MEREFPKLALDDEVLMMVDKPARYIGCEVNSVRKDLKDIDVRFCMCFPDVYEVGMSHLGISILYDMFNRRKDVWCERVYSPWTDLDKIMRERNIPLFALESQDPIKCFDFLGITLQYEMCYTNILQILDLSKIPLLAKDRGEDDPIVVGGGPCSYNGEPIADFFDFFYIGEGETRYYDIIDIYKEKKKNGWSRKQFLEKIAELNGVYVPAFYEPVYNEDGTIKEIKVINSHAKPQVHKEVETHMSDTYYPDKPIIPYVQAVQDKVTLEIQRGCIRGCRFCQAGMIYRPIRSRKLDFLKEKADKMIQNTGYEDITLSSLSSSDYNKLGDLVKYIMDKYTSRGVNISLPSLRIDGFSLDVMGKIQDIKKSSLTFAPEAGSQRMRDVINKGITEEEILKGASDAFSLGWQKVKLYFMLGQPFEQEEDVKAIPELADKIARVYYEIPKDQRNGKCNITISTSFFVPKPFTPFQWAPQDNSETFIAKQQLLKGHLMTMLNQKSIRYMWHDAKLSVLEGVFARGDRRLSQVILKAYESGCFFDAWTDYYDNEKWLKAFEECGIPIEFYTTRQRSDDEIFPWDMIDAGVSKRFLLAEYKKAEKAEVTLNCRERCGGCGAASFGVGICFDKIGAL